MDKNATVIDRWAMPHDAEGIDYALTRLAQLGKPELTLVAIEAEKRLIVDRLIEAGFSVVAIHPNAFNAARPCRHSVGNRWLVDETYVKFSGTWRYVYRAVDQHSQVVNVYVSKGRNIPAPHRFFKTALLAHDERVEAVTDLAQALETVIE